MDAHNDEVVATAPTDAPMITRPTMSADKLDAVAMRAVPKVLTVECVSVYIPACDGWRRTQSAAKHRATATASVPNNVEHGDA